MVVVLDPIAHKLLSRRTKRAKVVKLFTTSSMNKWMSCPNVGPRYYSTLAA